MTSLVDVIFLLLLFFMLTSTFTRFSELQLSASASGGTAVPDAPPLFLRLGEVELSLNGTPVELQDLSTDIAARMEGPTRLLLSVDAEVTSQRLVDALVAIGTRPDLSVLVLD
jgi:biopolymer transport protein ExbD